MRDLAREVSLDGLKGGLKNVAKARNLVGARLDLQFGKGDDPYYNVYRYAFFGLVPEELTPVAVSAKGALPRKVKKTKKAR